MQQFNLNLVSVIIPTYNRSNSLTVSLNSITNQTYKNIELIVIDDNSSDNTKEIINSLEIPNLKFIIHEKNLGAPAARNTGIKNCTGDFIAFMDDDDMWHPEKIERQLNYLIQNPEADAVFCEFKYVLKNKFYYPDKIMFDNNLLDLSLNRSLGSFSLPLIRKNCIDVTGLIDINLPSCQDWDYWIRLVQNFNLKKISDCLVTRNLSKGQITSDINKKIKGREYLLNKHWDLISKYPVIENMHLSRLGSLNTLAGNTKAAKDYFLKSFKTYPYSISTIIHIFLSCFSSNLHKYLINRFGIHKYGTINHYH